MKKETYERDRVIDRVIVVVSLPANREVGLHRRGREQGSNSAGSNTSGRVFESSEATRRSGKGRLLDCLGCIECSAGVELMLIIALCYALRCVVSCL
jgi:hypothetical protein